MIALALTGNERLQFQYILPVQGSLETLELVDSILKKCRIDSTDVNEVKSVNFEPGEIALITRMITLLDREQQLPFQALSLVKKFLNLKETTNG